MDLAVIPFLALAWVVNATLTSLVPYECIGGKVPVIEINESGETK